MQRDELEARAGEVLSGAVLPELGVPQAGKVRENYDLPDGRRILIATDRLSAFDRVLAVIPFKGQVLTGVARYWFDATGDICPNHVIEYPDPNVVVARRLRILPVEMVVRGYLAGTTNTSILTFYKEGRREMYGIRLPDGLRDNDPLPHPIVTPTTKGSDGAHDEPLSPDDILRRGLLTAEQWDRVRAYALALFARGQEMAARRGLILADTKYEFGLDAEGRVVLADEIHTPDSSRYWMATTYAERRDRGEAPESFDKDVIRRWVNAHCNPYHDEVPPIPAEVVLHTAEVYIGAFETITGTVFAPPPPEPPLERIRRNLAAWQARGAAGPKTPA